MENLELNVEEGRVTFNAAKGIDAQKEAASHIRRVEQFMVRHKELIPEENEDLFYLVLCASQRVKGDLHAVISTCKKYIADLDRRKEYLSANDFLNLFFNYVFAIDWP